MREVSVAVRTAYRTALKNNITYNSKVVPVYGKIVPVDAKFPYIYFANQASQNDSSKDEFANQHTINVEIVHGTMDGSDESATEDISNQVKQILGVLDQSDYPTIISPFWFVEITFDVDTELIQRTETHWVFRKILTFNNIIDQLS